MKGEWKGNLSCCCHVQDASSTVGSKRSLESASGGSMCGEPIVMALAAMQETTIGGSNWGPRLSKRIGKAKAMREKLFNAGDKIVFLEVICTAYDRMGFGRLLVDWVQTVYSRVYGFVGAALRSTEPPYGFYMKTGFKLHDALEQLTFDAKEPGPNGTIRPRRIFLQDCDTKGFLMMKPFAQSC